MPIPKPKKNETRVDYISRVIEFLRSEGYDEDQAAAIAYKQWRERK